MIAEKLNNLGFQLGVSLRATIIACISDEEKFAGDVYNYLISELQKQKDLDQSKNLKVNADLIKLDESNKEIQIDTSIPKEIIKQILQSFLKSDPVKFKDYDVVEFGDAFTIGRILDPSKRDMFSCEICGFFTPYAEELQTHRMTHYGIG
jgi:hypothetical protein